MLGADDVPKLLIWAGNNTRSQTHHTASCSAQRQARQATTCGANTEQKHYTCSELEKEAEAGAVLYRNTFGTQPRKPWGPLQNAFDLYLKNPANTNVVLWGDRLLALWEVC